MSKLEEDNEKENLLQQDFTEDYFQDRALLKLFLKNEKDISEEEEAFCHQYLGKLSSYGLSRLSSEPSHLEDERENMLSQIQDLAYNNYQTFIQAAACTKDIFRDFDVIEQHVDSLTSSIPKFADTVECFAKKSQDINSRRKQNSTVLSHHTQLLEILEIPQLMDTCVRNGYYEEALELSNFVKRLGKKFTNIQIIAEICDEVTRCMQFMLNQLLQQIRGNVQLPACLRIISYIRQLSVFKEAELRIIFLQSRDFWFEGLLADIPKEDAYQHLSKVVETSRVNLFDIITQYKAIFSDDDQPYVFGSDKSTSYAHILNSWVTKKISAFIATLKEDLGGNNVLGRLDSIYAQSMYFGLSFSRIGADFRGILVPIFQKYALAQFDYVIKKSTSRFEDSINTFTLSSMAIRNPPLKKHKGVPLDANTPPQELLLFPCIAIYLNGVLAAFNTFRQFAVTSLIINIKEMLCCSLDKLMMALVNWARLESQSQPFKTKEDVRFYCFIVCRYFLPYFKLAFDSFFNVSDVQKMIGRLPANEIGENFKNLYTINLSKYFSLLKDFVDLDELYELLDTTGTLENVSEKTENISEDNPEHQAVIDNEDQVLDVNG